MYAKRSHKWGQVFLGFVFAFIALILLTVGLIRVWAWFSANLSGRSYYYQRTRINSSRGVQYSELDKATHRPFALDDDWIFKGKTPHMPVLHLENLDPDGGIDVTMCCENCCTGKAHEAGCACKQGTVTSYNLSQLEAMPAAKLEYPVMKTTSATKLPKLWIPAFVEITKDPLPNPPDPLTFFGNKEVKSPDTIDLTHATNTTGGARGWWGHIPAGVKNVECTDSQGNAQPCLCKRRCRCRVAVMSQINALREQATMQRESAGQYDDNPNPPPLGADSSKKHYGMLGNAKAMNDKADECANPWDICWYFSGFGKTSAELNHAADVVKRQGEKLLLASEPIDGGAGNNLGYIGELQNCCEQSCATPDNYDTSTKEGVKGLDDCNKRAIDSCLAEARSHIGDNCEQYANTVISQIDDDKTAVNKMIVQLKEQQLWAQDTARSCVMAARNYCVWQTIHEDQRKTLNEKFFGPAYLETGLPQFVPKDVCLDGSTPPVEVPCSPYVTVTIIGNGGKSWKSSNTIKVDGNAPSFFRTYDVPNNIGGIINRQVTSTATNCYQAQLKGPGVKMACPATAATSIALVIAKTYSNGADPLTSPNKSQMVSNIDIPNTVKNTPGVYYDRNVTNAYMNDALALFQADPTGQMAAFSGCLARLADGCCSGYSGVDGDFGAIFAADGVATNNVDPQLKPTNAFNHDCEAPHDTVQTATTPLDVDKNGAVIVPYQINGAVVPGDATINNIPDPANSGQQIPYSATITGSMPIGSLEYSSDHHDPSDPLYSVYRDSTQYPYPSPKEDFSATREDEINALYTGLDDLDALTGQLQQGMTQGSAVGGECCHTTYCGACPLPANTGDDVSDDLANKNRDNCLVMVPLKKVQCINNLINTGYARLYGLIDLSTQPGSKAPPTCTHADGSACSLEETANACSPR